MTAASATPKATFKDFVSAAGDELKKAGKPVCHGTLMEAMSAAMGGRSWNHFCAQLGMAVPVVAAQVAQAAPAPVGKNTNMSIFVPTADSIYAVRFIKTMERANTGAFTALPRTEEAIALLFASTDTLLPVRVRMKATDKAPSIECHLDVMTGTLQPAVSAGMYFLECLHTPNCFLSVMVDTDGRLSLESNRALRRGLDSYLMSEYEAFGLPYAVGIEVPAVLASEDLNQSTTFDARPYLVTATDDQLIRIWDDGLSDSIAMDEVAETVNRLVPNQGIQEVEDYVNTVHRFNEVGTECSIDPAGFIAWLREQRPEVYALLVCNQEGIWIEQDTDELTLPGEEPSGAATTYSFSSEEFGGSGYPTMGEAALAAMAMLHGHPELVYKGNAEFGNS